MEVRAISKSVRMSPRKVRLVADSIRHLSLERAFEVLQGTQKRGAGPLLKTLQSAVANGVNNLNLDTKELKIKTIMVNEGQALKRFRPSTRGRIHPYKKRGSNIHVVLEAAIASPAVVKPAVVKAEAKKIEAKAAETKEMKKGGKK